MIKNKKISECAIKEKKKKHKYWQLTKVLWKRNLSNKQNISYKLTKRTKTEMYKKNIENDQYRKLLYYSL